MFYIILSNEKIMKINKKLTLFENFKKRKPNLTLVFATDNILKLSMEIDEYLFKTSKLNRFSKKIHNIMQKIN